MRNFVSNILLLTITICFLVVGGAIAVEVIAALLSTWLVQKGLFSGGCRIWLVLDLVLLAVLLAVSLEAVRELAQNGQTITGVRRYLLAVGVIGLLMLGVSILACRPGCSQQSVTHDFEENIGGWDVRWEGANKLGIEVLPDDGHHCGSGNWSLGFQFTLTNAAPFDKAQVKYEAPIINLHQELSGWVYVPRDAPSDLQGSCFILEDNQNGRMIGKPEWPWYQTKTVPLSPGEWTWVRCLESDFVPNLTGAHWDEPLLVGFEFIRKSHGFYSGTMYLDKVALR